MRADFLTKKKEETTVYLILYRTETVLGMYIVQRDDYSQQCGFVYLNTAKRVELKSSHHQKKEL